MATENKEKTKEYIRPMPATWWLKRPAYIKFMLREISSVFIAAYCLFLLVLMDRAGDLDSAEFRSYYQESLSHWSSVLFQLIALAFAVFCSVTTFNLTPKVLVVRRGEEKLPDFVIAGAHYLAWAVVSLVLILFALSE